MAKTEKAIAARKQIIDKNMRDLAKKVKHVDNLRKSSDLTITQACRDIDISTERYYRFKRKN